jgi:WD40 repeat protein
VLDLTIDCFRFVTGYFGIIRASAPHIYHSALILAPQESIVQKLYKSHAQPLTRVIHGAPMSWDPGATAATYPCTIQLAVWSPCNRFIAITFENDTATVDILDSVTFQQLQTLEAPEGMTGYNRALIFSPDSHILTRTGGGHSYVGGPLNELFIVSWDLQTGGIASVVRWPGPEKLPGAPSFTYSADGKMLGVCCWCHEGTSTARIIICDVASGVCMHSHSLNDVIPLSTNIWTCGGSLQFATVDVTTITIWEVAFSSGGTPMKVETLPTLDNLCTIMLPERRNQGSIEFLPMPCRLALVFLGRVWVWDVQNSKCLLECTDTKFNSGMSFSSNGCFFACSSQLGICLWKESPTGYVLHRVLESRTDFPTPLLSQNGESVVVVSECTVQLWHTNGFATHPSSISAQAPQQIVDFLLDFSHDGTWVAVVMEGYKTVTVINLKSGIPQLTIDAGVEVDSLRVIGNTVVIFGNWKIITWDLPVEGYIPNARMGLEDSSQTINLSGDMPSNLYGASISPNCHYIVLVQNQDLCIYSASTGECLGCEVTRGYLPQFTPDGWNVWCPCYGTEAEVWRVGGGQNMLECLEHRTGIEDPPEESPWGSSCGYRVTEDWWILGPDGKRLLMLPPAWQSDMVQRVWKGKFLALLHSGLPEPVILELELCI